MKMPTLVLILGGLSMLVGAAGCGSTFGKTADERAHMYQTITSSEYQMAKDDLDNFLLMDRRSRLTRWH